MQQQSVLALWGWPKVGQVQRQPPDRAQACQQKKWTVLVVPFFEDGGPSRRAGGALGERGVQDMEEEHPLPLRFVLELLPPCQILHLSIRSELCLLQIW